LSSIQNLYYFVVIAPTPHEKHQRYKSAGRPIHYNLAELVNAENEQLPSEIHKLIIYVCDMEELL